MAASVDFAFSLMKVASTGKENFVISPLSIGSSLALLLEGSDGETHKELTKLLGGNDMCLQYSSLLHALSAGKSRVATSVHSRLFVHETFPIKPKFSTRAENLNFNDGKGSAEAVNSFVRNSTTGAAGAIAKPEDFNPMSVALLVNTVHFEAKWAEPFDDSVTRSKGTFYGVAGERQAEFMIAGVPRKKKVKVLYSKTKNLTVVGLKYQDPAYTMVFLMPEDNYAEWKNSLSASELREAIDSMWEKHIKLDIPKFTISSSADCGSVLKQLGAARMFSGHTAGLSGISDVPGFHISDIVQNATIVVNEKGTTAVAATKCRFEMMGYGDEHIIFDNPFLFIVKRGDHVIFIGEVC